MNLLEARSSFSLNKRRFETLGAVFPDVTQFVPDGWGEDIGLAMDAQPGLVTVTNSGIPAFLTTMIDPQIYEILFSPLEAKNIFDEVQKGDWTLNSVMFPTIEHTGETSAYGDYSNNGSVNANTNFPSRQPFLFQTILQYGDRELDVAGAAKINWLNELNGAAAWAINRYQNQTYFFGVQGLQNYGFLNDPNLTAALVPSPKAFGNNQWVTNNVITATPNEIFLDIQSLVIQLIQQSGGNINMKSNFVLALSPTSEFAITATNSFDVNVTDLISKNIPNLKIVSAIQYGVQSTSNPQGVVGGNYAQMICTDVRGQKTGYVAYNVKMRAGRLIPDLSSYKQKMVGGTLGAIIRQPFAIASMIGI
jgi:hypothetical protein